MTLTWWGRAKPFTTLGSPVDSGLRKLSLVSQGLILVVPGFLVVHMVTMSANAGVEVRASGYSRGSGDEKR